MTNTKPVRDTIYTYQEILGLVLRDDPFLMVEINGKWEPVQTEETFDVDREEPRIPGFNKTQWKYIRTTDEWIPLFHYVGERPIDTFVTTEPDINEPGKLWVCFKGYRQPQYGEEK